MHDASFFSVVDTVFRFHRFCGNITDRSERTSFLSCQMSYLEGLSSAWPHSASIHNIVFIGVRVSLVFVPTVSVSVRMEDGQRC
jgi:hypothetical protein